jgi:hypothetical protein
LAIYLTSSSFFISLPSFLQFEERSGKNYKEKFLFFFSSFYSTHERIPAASALSLTVPRYFSFASRFLSVFICLVVLPLSTFYHSSSSFAIVISFTFTPLFLLLSLYYFSGSRRTRFSFFFAVVAFPLSLFPHLLTRRIYAPFPRRVSAPLYELPFNCLFFSLKRIHPQGSKAIRSYKKERAEKKGKERWIPLLNILKEESTHTHTKSVLPFFFVLSVCVCVCVHLFGVLLGFA